MPPSSPRPSPDPEPSPKSAQARRIPGTQQSAWPQGEEIASSSEQAGLTGPIRNGNKSEPRHAGSRKNRFQVRFSYLILIATDSVPVLHIQSQRIELRRFEDRAFPLPVHAPDWSEDLPRHQ